MNFYRWFTNWIEFWFGIDLKPKENMAEKFKNSSNYETVFVEPLEIVFEKKKPKAKKTTKKPRQKEPEKYKAKKEAETTLPYKVNVVEEKQVEIPEYIPIKKEDIKSVLNTKTVVYIEPEKAYTKPKSSKRTKKEIK